MVKAFGRFHKSIFRNSNRVLNNFKIVNRKNDWDMDGVPNKWDCQPRNPMRQDFVPYNPDYKTYGQRVVQMPTKKLYYMRAMYGTTFGGRKSVFGDVWSEKDKRLQLQMINDLGRRPSDEEVVHQKALLKKQELEEKGYKVYPYKVREAKTAGLKVDVMARAPQVEVKQNIDFIMKPMHYSPHSSFRASSDEGTQEYIEHIKQGIQDPNAKVPMLQLGKYEFRKGNLGEGRHRIVAAQQLGMKTMPVLVDENVTDEDIYGSKRKMWKQKGYEDNDKDGIINADDCQPNNPNEQGPFHKRRRIYPIHHYSNKQLSDDEEGRDKGMPWGMIKKRMREKALEEEMNQERIDNINNYIKSITIKKKKSGWQDSDGDGVINSEDCDPNDSNKQDKPNKLVMERLNKLPIFIGRKRGTLEDIYNQDIKFAHISNTKEGKQFKQTRNNFYSTIKRYPNLVSDMEQTPIQDITLINDRLGKRSVRGVTVMQKGSIDNERNQNFIVMNVGKYKGENAGTLFHELGHAKDYDKIKTQSDYENYKKNENEIESERKAEENKTRRLIEMHGREMEPAIKEGEKRYIKNRAVELQGVDESFYTESNPEDVKSINKQKLLAEQGRKEREFNMEQNKQKGMQMFGYEDNDNDGVINAEDCEPENPDKQGLLHEDMYKKILEQREKRKRDIQEAAEKIKTQEHKQAAYEALKISADKARMQREKNIQDTAAFKHDIKNLLTNKPIAIDLTNRKVLTIDEQQAGQIAQELDREVGSFMIKDDAKSILAYKLYGKQDWELTKEEQTHINYLIRQNVR